MDSKYTGAEVEARLDEVNQLSLKVTALESRPSGGVESVNGKTGAVTLTANDVGSVPSEKVEQLEQKVEEFKVVSGGFRKLKILALGNSYSCDSFMYVPIILKSYGIDIELGIYSRGSGSLFNHVTEWSSASNPFYYIDTEVATAWTNPMSTNPLGAVTYKDWDIIVIQQSSQSSVTESSFEPSARNLIKLIQSVKTKPYKIGFNITINRASSGSDYEQVAKTILTNIKKCVDAEPIGIIFPYGSAIFSARKNETLAAVGDGGNLWAADQTHLQKGLPCYLAALANVEALFRQYYPQFSVLGDKTRTDANVLSLWNVYAAQGNTTGINEENCFLAQCYAVIANNNPFAMADSVSGGTDIDIPETSKDVTAINIVGGNEITDSGNYSISYTPSDTTQTGVTWSIVSGAEYAEISSSGVLTAKDGADNSSVTIKAVSTHNSLVTATKVVSVTKYVEPLPDEPEPEEDFFTTHKVIVGFITGKTINTSNKQFLTFDSTAFADGNYLVEPQSGYKVRRMAMNSYLDVSNPSLTMDAYRETSEMTTSFTTDDFKAGLQATRTHWSLNVSKTSGANITEDEIRDAVHITKIS